MGTPGWIKQVGDLVKRLILNNFLVTNSTLAPSKCLLKLCVDGMGVWGACVGVCNGYRGVCVCCLIL